jgi:mono/diheme cytochrome c family protein
MKTRMVVGALLVSLTLCTQASEQEIRNKIALGALAFSDNCRKCHQIDGYGEEALYPSLHDPALLADKSLLIRTILHGRIGEKSDGTQEHLMPSLDYLTNQEIVAIIAFISNSWGPDMLLVTEDEVKEARRVTP